MLVYQPRWGMREPLGEGKYPGNQLAFYVAGGTPGVHPRSVQVAVHTPITSLTFFPMSAPPAWRGFRAATGGHGRVGARTVRGGGSAPPPSLAIGAAGN